MSPEELKVMHDRFVEKVINNRDLSAVEEFIAPEYKAQGWDPPVEGPDGYRQLIERIRITFPDIHFTTDDFFVSGDKTVTRWTVRGTQLGTFLVYPPTGKEATWGGITISRVNAEGKAVEEWILPDNFSLLLQLGVIPMPSQVPA